MVHAVLQQQGHVLPGHAERKFESFETGQPLKIVLVIGGIVGVNGRLDTLKHLVRVLLATSSRVSEETFPEGSTSKISSLQDTATAALIKNISIFFISMSLLRS